MNDMLNDTDVAYIAGLFDGEGSIHIRRGVEKKKKHNNKPGYRLSNSMRLSMEITMTDRSVLICLILNNIVGVVRSAMRLKFVVYCFLTRIPNSVRYNRSLNTILIFLKKWLKIM